MLSRFVSRGCDTGDAELRKRIRDAITDTVGCMIAGGRSETLHRLLKAVSAVENGPVRVFGTSQCLTAPFAALANGTSAHAYDLDDWEAPGNTHPSAVMVPALLAASTIKKTDGASLLRAYATGFEIIARIGEIMTLEHYVRGHHSTATIGTLGAAAAVANLFELSPEQSGHAVAMAASQAAGYLEQFGSNTKAMQAGFSAKAGLLAALLAQQGLTANGSVLDGDKGIFSILADNRKTDISPLERLGTIPAIVEYGINAKLYPSCSCTHRLIDCARQISINPEFEPSAVTRIEASLPDFHKAILRYAEPETESEALFSLEFCIAHTLLGGDISLNALEDQAWAQPETREMAAKIVVGTEPAKNPHLSNDPNQPDRLLVRCGDREFQAECGHPPGSVGAPASSGQLKNKFCEITGLEEKSFDCLKHWPEAEDVFLHVEKFAGAVDD